MRYLILFIGILGFLGISLGSETLSMPSLDSRGRYLMQDYDLGAKLDAYLEKDYRRLERLEYKISILLGIHNVSTTNSGKNLSDDTVAVLEYIQRFYLPYKKRQRDESDGLGFMQLLADEFSKSILYHIPSTKFGPRTEGKNAFPSAGLYFSVSYDLKSGIDKFLEHRGVGFTLDDLLAGNSDECVAQITQGYGEIVAIYCSGDPMKPFSFEIVDDSKVALLAMATAEKIGTHYYRIGDVVYYRKNVYLGTDLEEEFEKKQQQSIVGDDFEIVICNQDGSICVYRFGDMLYINDVQTLIDIESLKIYTPDEFYITNSTIISSRAGVYYVTSLFDTNVYELIGMSENISFLSPNIVTDGVTTYSVMDDVKQVEGFDAESYRLVVSDEERLLWRYESNGNIFESRGVLGAGDYVPGYLEQVSE